MTLFRQYFRQQFVGLLIWVGVALLLVLALTSAATGVVASGGMDAIMASLPESIRQMAGVTTGLSPVDAYLTMKAGPFFALLLCPYAVLLALGIVTREVDRRTIDFLLAQPVDRRQVLVHRSAVMALNTAVMAVAMWLVMYLDLTRQGLEASFGGFALLLFNAWLLAMAVASVCLLSSMWLDDYSLGVKIWVSVACGGYPLEYLLRATGVSRWARVWSPYSFLDAPEVVRSSSIPLADAVILIALIALGIGLSVRAFERKQIAA